MKTLDIILTIGLLAILLYGVVALKEIKSKGAECVSTPLQYGVRMYSEELNTDMFCTCSFTNSKYKSLFITKNSTEPLSDA